MDGIASQVFDSFRRVQKDLDGSSLMNTLETQLKTPKGYLAAAGAAIYLLLVTLNFSGTGQLFSNIAGLIVPGYFSIIALETPNKDDDTQWLTYWLVYAVFSVFEYWCSTILYFIPLYWLYKTLALLFLGLPQFKGAKIVYENLIRPMAREYMHLDAAAHVAEKASGGKDSGKVARGGKGGKKKD